MEVFDVLLRAVSGTEQMLRTSCQVSGEKIGKVGGGPGRQGDGGSGGGGPGIEKSCHP